MGEYPRRVDRGESPGWLDDDGVEWVKREKISKVEDDKGGDDVDCGGRMEVSEGGGGEAGRGRETETSRDPWC